MPARWSGCARCWRVSPSRSPTSTTSRRPPRRCSSGCATCTSTTSSSAAASCCSAITTRPRWRSRCSACARASWPSSTSTSASSASSRARASTRGSPTCASACPRRCAGASTSSSPTRRTHPPASACSRRAAIEALSSERPGRLLVAYGYPEGSPALGLKVQTELSALELVYEAVLPDFNAYDGALAIGSRAALYVLRPTKRSRKIAVRRAGRHAEAMYTRGRQAIESSAAAAAGPHGAGQPARRAVLRRGLGQARAAAERAARRPAAGRDGRGEPRPGPGLQPLSGGGRGGGAAGADRRPQPHRGLAHRGRAGAVARGRRRRVTRSSRSRVRGGTRRSRSSSCAAKAARATSGSLYREATATSIARADSGAPQSSSDAGVATL